MVMIITMQNTTGGIKGIWLEAEALRVHVNNNFVLMHSQNIRNQIRTRYWDVSGFIGIVEVLVGGPKFQFLNWF